MADRAKKISELVALTAATSDDILPIVNDPSGNAVNYKITVQNFANSLATAFANTVALTPTSVSIGNTTSFSKANTVGFFANGVFIYGANTATTTTLSMSDSYVFVGNSTQNTIMTQFGVLINGVTIGRSTSSQVANAATASANSSNYRTVAQPIDLIGFTAVLTSTSGSNANYYLANGATGQTMRIGGTGNNMHNIYVWVDGLYAYNNSAVQLAKAWQPFANVTGSQRAIAAVVYNGGWWIDNNSYS